MVSDEIARLIPFLRRFARALSGSQKSGDAYVVVALETIIAEPAVLEQQRGLRAGLYRVFLKVWRATPINGLPDQGGGDEGAAGRNLAAVEVEPRIAFLLSALENFDTPEIAQTLDCSEAEAQALIDRAAAEIVEQIRTDVLIIEDEPLIALDLQHLVEQSGHRVSGVARTHDDALAAALSSPPGLILADIQLADGSSGLSAVADILKTFDVPVIFITAYPERFLTGKAPEPAFLISKPFNPESVKATIAQALFFDRRPRREASAAERRA
jgi:CheY-like chemotaxis protein/DNA-directed RNA polymerase specialized sigma24 family protein